ncbi:MAG: hypothetical protein ACRCZN_01960 [Lactococcus lactis]
MRLTQLILQSEKTVKKPNKTESIELEEHSVLAKKERIYQSRLDDYSMQGLQHVNRYIVYNLGELSDKIFSYFIDEKGKRYRILTLTENTNNNEWTIEGVVADGI